MLKTTIGMAVVITAATAQAQISSNSEVTPAIVSSGGSVDLTYQPMPVSTLPAPRLRLDPALAQDFQNALDRGDIEVSRQYVPIGVGAGVLVGGYFGGSGYLMVHSVTNYQAATFQGFMMATLGGAITGAASGGGSATVFFVTNAFGAAWGAATAWIDALHQTPDEVGGQ